MPTTTTTTPADRPASTIAATGALVIIALIAFSHIPVYQSGADIPVGVVALQVVLGVAAVVTAVGLWMRRRWVIPLALVLGVFTVLVDVSGVVTSESTTGKVVTAFGALFGLAVIGLIAPHATRRSAT